MSDEIVRRVTIEEDKGSKSSGHLIIDKIQYQNGNQMQVEKFLVIVFKALKSNTNHVDMTEGSPPHSTTSVSIASDDKKNVLIVSAKIIYETPTKFFVDKNYLKFQNDGDWITKLNVYKDSVHLYADHLSYGIVRITSTNVKLHQIVHFKPSIDQFEHSFDSAKKSNEFTLLIGQYEMKADDFINSNKIIVVFAETSPDKFIIKTNKTTNVKVKYSSNPKSGAINFTTIKLS